MTLAGTRSAEDRQKTYGACERPTEPHSEATRPASVKSGVTLCRIRSAGGEFCRLFVYRKGDRKIGGYLGCFRVGFFATRPHCSDRTLSNSAHVGAFGVLGVR